MFSPDYILLRKMNFRGQIVLLINKSSEVIFHLQRLGWWSAKFSDFPDPAFFCSSRAPLSFHSGTSTEGPLPVQNSCVNTKGSNNQVWKERRHTTRYTLLCAIGCSSRVGLLLSYCKVPFGAEDLDIHFCPHLWLLSGSTQSWGAWYGQPTALPGPGMGWHSNRSLLHCRCTPALSCPLHHMVQQLQCLKTKRRIINISRHELERFWAYINQ